MISLLAWLPAPMFLLGVSVPSPMFLPGGLCPGGLFPGGRSPYRDPLESEKQVVRILLECFLVAEFPFFVQELLTSLDS